MRKVRTAIRIDEKLMRAVRQHATDSGKSPSEVIEDVLSRQFGRNLLEAIWKDNNMSEQEAMDLAVEAQEAARAPTEAERLKGSDRTPGYEHARRRALRALKKAKPRGGRRWHRDELHD